MVIDLLSKRVIFRLDTLVLTCQSLFLMCETALLNLQFILLADALCNFLNADFRIVLPLGLYPLQKELDCSFFLIEYSLLRFLLSLFFTQQPPLP